MNILQVNYLDNVGGAARIAWSLHNGFQHSGHNAWMTVGQKHSQDPFTVQISDLPTSPIPNYLYRQSLLADQRSMRFGRWTVGGILRKLAQPQHYLEWTFGREDFHFPHSRKIVDLIPERPDVIHLHNLHGGYFDLRYLPILSRQFPTVITLHDSWLLSGHCAYSLDCQRWMNGCGACPYPDVYPAIKYDATRYNWKRKKEIYKDALLYIVTPSRWLLNQVELSILASGTVRSKVINNGVDLNIFHPLEKQLARSKVKLPIDAHVLLFVASGIKKNPYKDFETVEMAINNIARKNRSKRIVAIALGESGPIQTIGNIELHFVPFSTDPHLVASYYQAADIYMHAARADTFPNVILEAMACGTPVVATAVGGIPEQVQDGETGFLTPKANPEVMADKIMELLDSDDLRKKMEINAGRTAKLKFGLDRMVAGYLAYYNEIIQDWRLRN